MASRPVWRCWICWRVDNMDWPNFFYLFILPTLTGYFIGSTPFGLILTKLAGLEDIRKIGSGNIGATNVLRTGHKKLALLTLLLDLLKGIIAVLIIAIFNHSYQIEWCKEVWSAGIDCIPHLIPFQTHPFLYVGLAAVIGHCYPVWLKFRGGKGVATTLGVLLVAVPQAGLIACLTWLATAIITRYSSLSALVAVLVAPFATLIFYGQTSTIICLLLTVLIWFKHRANIRRLLKGEEPKIGRKAAA